MRLDPIKFLRKLFKTESKVIVRPPQRNPRPPEWNLTVAQVMGEMKAGLRPKVSGDELRWAKEYERSLIPPEFRFPLMGDVYEAKEDLTADYITAWAGPFSGGGEAQLKKGERVWVHTKDVEEMPIGVYAEPVDYKALEERIIPLAERNNPKYGGMYFYLTTVELNTRFTLAETGYKGRTFLF